MAAPSSDGRRSPTPSHSPARRQRAPTITIDTSAVSPSSVMDRPLLLQTLSNTGHPLQEDQDNPISSDPTSQLVTSSPVDLRAAPSFESRESRPTSPHNVSSPTSRWTGNDHNFLAVPGARSRGNSIDSNEGGNSPSSYGGETVIPSPTSSNHGDSSKRPSGTHGNHDIINDEEALKPDKENEADFEVEDNKFAFSPGQMNKLINPKSLSAFHAVGGLAGLEKGLRTDRKSGLSADETHLDGQVTFEEALTVTTTETPTKASYGRPVTRTNTADTHASIRKLPDDCFIDRKRIFKDNHLPEKKAKGILQLAWLAYNDKVLILLTVAAVISLALGLYQTFGSHPDGEAPIEWVEGVAIMAAIIIVVVVGAANDWQKERQFVKLNKKKEDRTVKAIRSGRSQEISIHDLLAGDVVLLEPGDLIPVDGIFIEGHNVKCDESSATGESDIMKKHPAEDVFRAIEAHENVTKLDPFIISGGKVSEGIGRFLVTSVGVNSSYGKTMMSLRDEAQTTPLQSKLNVLAEYIAKLGLAAGLLLFVVVFIKFLVQLRGNTSTPSQKGQEFLQIFIVAVTIVVVAVPEGLPLAVTLALAFATTRMLKDNNLVRLLRACETMGNATTICSDKTGTLTQNRMNVVAGTLGTSSRFGDKQILSHDNTGSPVKGKDPATDDHADDISTGEFVSTLNENVRNLLEQSIAINSTAFEGEQDGVRTFIGSKTETALLSFARDHLGMGPISIEHSNTDLVQLVPFDSGRKCMASVVKLQDGKFRMYVKGASEILLSKCTRIIRDPTSDVSDTRLTQDNAETLARIISTYASRSLRTIGLLYKDFEQWPPKGVRTQEDDPKQAQFDDVFKDMVFLGVVGIQDPLRDGVTDSVRACQKAGVFVRMVTGDNVLTAKAIAGECGIYTAGGVVMEGPKFRNLSEREMNQIIPRLQVLARSSPRDKEMLVQRLQGLGETVAVTGDGTNDAPALKRADVGFSMGIAGTEVAKEASDIILMDDNFSSIVKAIMWGRAVNDSVKKFLQFQITVNITAVMLTFVSAVASNNESSVLTAVQLLWVNLIMDTFAALALATDPPTPSILDRKPDPKSAPLITLTMWKMIIGQAIYQLVVTFILNFAGTSILSYQSPREQAQLQTLVFNTFVWMQIFNQYNNRRLDNKFNVFEGVTRNYFFIGIQVIIVAGQIMIVFVGGRAFSVTRLNGAQWGYSIVLGALSMPIAIIIRLIPDELIRKMIPESLKKKSTPQLVVFDEDERFAYNPKFEEYVREELNLLKKLRGGRLHHLKYRLQHPRETLLPRSRSGSRSRSVSIPQTPNGDHNRSEAPSPAPPSPDSRSRRRGRSRTNSTLGAAVMTGIIAGSVAGWSPIDRNHGDEDSLKFSRSRGRSDLENQPGVEVHPDTQADDPVIAENPDTLRVPPSQFEETSPDFGISSGPSVQLSPPRSPRASHSRNNSSTSSAGPKN
ncbi:MAG: hypothetical protein M1827_003234 [Pycnora praestabilis]|nr:MAG: hypothetical protein M1827_003234 [Pycnora praestabilis]